MLICWGKNTVEEKTSKAKVLSQEHSYGVSLKVRGGGTARAEQRGHAV